MKKVLYITILACSTLWGSCTEKNKQSARTDSFIEKNVAFARAQIGNHDLRHCGVQRGQTEADHVAAGAGNHGRPAGVHVCARIPRPMAAGGGRTLQARCGSAVQLLQRASGRNAGGVRAHRLQGRHGTRCVRLCIVHDRPLRHPHLSAAVRAERVFGNITSVLRIFPLFFRRFQKHKAETSRKFRFLGELN